MLTTVLALALSPSALPPSLPALPVFGPPALCHPVHIGDARSLPWDGRGGFDRDDDYDLDRLVGDTAAILRRSDDVLVHMETLRRAGVYVHGLRERDPARGRTLARGLVAELRRELGEGDVSEDEAGRRRVGLRWFDVGYALGVLRQAGHSLDDGGRRALDEATRRLSAEPAVFLGRSLALWREHGGDDPLRDLDRAVRLAEDHDDLLRANLLEAGSFFFDVRSHDQLVARLRRELAGA